MGSGHSVTYYRFGRAVFLVEGKCVLYKAGIEVMYVMVTCVTWAFA